ncbi:MULTISPECIES: 4-(cytidine 5'-diphospho)-2-C-methyl-D-erythritol kinase [Hyphomonas]|uniref:4-(cytidine 5'-diphospho)-2-C-methyl-D-erythritol kinase n=1 Tax=Hyphomonas TaxID=85 RepID=UPI000C641B2B|nr:MULTISPECIES: 4-(cytidine 5'-diphospho)-2-C-methyl-D-erythritol kinase [Hyphomonas]MBB40745.1 4-(cytidine 5'-diphospho)-2-C-methyl-D-erythritol kinase [Hyphomonas sp.]|tara:strand:- start:479 stop:1372 length:894 start_codon:yes stop_codon:yes gene_type:complete
MKTDDYSALAPAKVNLFLHVGPVQPNGRHPLDSLVMFAGEAAADRLSVMTSDDLSMTLTGPGMTNPDHIGPVDDNLVLRAARALQAETGSTQGAAFTLEKLLPIAAGIGGGSADAAAALRLLTDLWGTDTAAAHKIAPALGGDVPVALQGHAALMQGEGERIRRAPDLPRVPALLVNPGLACPTGPVFRAYDEAGGGAGFREFGAVPPFERVWDLVHWLGNQRNDLQAPAVAAVPEIAGVLDTLEALPDVLLARMSGSGATCFALFDTGDAARRAAAQLSAERPGWWIRATSLGDAA